MKLYMKLLAILGINFFVACGVTVEDACMHDCIESSACSGVEVDITECTSACRDRLETDVGQSSVVQVYEQCGDNYACEWTSCVMSEVIGR